eukprot:1197790-Rhodomonas_salina.2
MGITGTSKLTTCTPVIASHISISVRHSSYHSCMSTSMGRIVSLRRKMSARAGEVAEDIGEE